MKPESKFTFTTKEEALAIGATGFNHGYPFWIYEVEEGFQISTKGFYFETPPDHVMSFEEFSKLKPYDFLYEDIKGLNKYQTIRIGLDHKGGAFQKNTHIPLKQIKDHFLNNQCYLNITCDFHHRKEGMNLALALWKYLIIEADFFIAFKVISNNSFIIAKADNHHAVQRELRNVHVFYKMLSDKNTLII